MSYSIDLNLLLFSVDEESPFHKEAKKFLISSLEKEDTCFLAWETIYGFLRISTHPGIFRNPLPTSVAVENIQSLLDHPRVETLSATDEAWKIFCRLTREMAVKGNLVADAVLAAILEDNSIRTLYTHDRDFRKFTFLKPLDPLSSL